jgi:hexosaminidase
MMMQKKFLFLTWALFFGAAAFCQTINIIPQPAQLTEKKGQFVIDKTTKIAVLTPADQSAANYFNNYLQAHYGFKLSIGKTAGAKSISLNSNKKADGAKEGAYRFQSGSNGVAITGGTAAGVFYGIQTLIQLLPVEKSMALQIPAVEIKDEPRFGYRGAMLDVGRHFFSVDFVKKYVDYLALHKMNYFHWHLTEDQGWRIEIKKYPKLTSVGAFRNGTIIGRYPGKGNDETAYGGFYTQEQIKEVVAYAGERFITVVPEIEMPGHGSAAIAAYPELSCFPDTPTIHYFPKGCTWFGDTTGKKVQQTWGVFDDVFCAGNEYTFKFLQDVINEVLPMFPGKYIHVGGDECPKNNWKKCPRCQQRIKENGLKDEHGLQSYLIQRMEKYVNAKGKTLIGWDEILEGGLAANAVVMSWRGEEGGIAAAKDKHQVIMTPGSHVYLDHSQTQQEDSVTIGGFTSLEKIYSYEPIPKELNETQAKYVLGAQGNVWTEYMAYPSKVEYMIFPRLSALSEVLWSPKATKNWDAFKAKTATQYKRYNSWESHYFKEK